MTQVNGDETSAIIKSVVTIDKLQSPPERLSSFARVPSYIHGTGHPSAELLFVTPCIRLLGCRNWFKSLDDFGSTRLRGSVTNLWPRTRASVLCDGYATAFVNAIISILAYHVLRTLFPWLSAYLYHSPIEDLRLALSRGDIFLDEALAVPWSEILFMHAQKVACDFVAVHAIHLLVAGPSKPSHDANIKEQPRRSRVVDVARIIYLTWSLSALQYIVDRVANTVAFGIAYGKLLSGGEAEYTALAMVLKEHWTKVPLSLYMLYSYAAAAMLPTISGAVACAVTGRPGLLFVLLLGPAVMRGVLKYRSKLFIALEMSGLFVALGLLVVVVVVLACEIVNDRRIMKASTREAANESLSRDTMGTTRLRRKGASRVRHASKDHR